MRLSGMIELNYLEGSISMMHTVYRSTDVVTLPEEMYTTHVTKHTFLRIRKSNGVTLFWKEYNKLLVIRFLILGVTVPLQLLVTAI